MKVAWENKDNLPYAYRILTQGDLIYAPQD
ncbi:hypothetical protein CGLO_10860 [Colletotrichum gloeosporioides Cg-14]|uniref:Uncharacterized protein n=1 Tax=Colletotrichum gloeosporioides (strain Cg-14) TaxID=1237896 RepID=T0K2A3_COLGC|nr:hypothetical protein CGLO_10860 [Colletotrichum gloeosporioides Cg-14]